jgi:hypothetical protein
MITDKEYLNNIGVSQSKLKSILKHPYYYINSRDVEDDEPSEVTLIGDAVDMILTQGKEYFESNFLVSNYERPSGQMGDYVWSLFVNREKEDREEIAYQEAGFKRDTLEKVKERFKIEGKDYFDELCEGIGKKVITPKQYETVEAIIESFKTNRFTYMYFDYNNDRFIHLNQYALYGEYNGFKIKGLLDKIIYDKQLKTIYVSDLKTTSKSLHFFENTIFEFRYDLQASFYMYLVAANLNLILKELGITSKDVEAIKFRFFVESQIHPGSPLMFDVSVETLDFGMNGGVRNGRTYEGFAQAFERLSFHLDCDLWDYRKEDYENQGVRTV